MQYDGDTRLSADEKKNYDRLYPLLDITTALDPQFNIAYRFGVDSLVRGIPERTGTDGSSYHAASRRAFGRCPTSGSTYHDAGFVEYWWRRDAAGCGRLVHQGRRSCRVRRIGWSRLRRACWPRAESVRPPAQLWTQLNRTADTSGSGRPRAAGCCSSTPKADIEILQPIMHKFYRRERTVSDVMAELIRGEAVCGASRSIRLDPCTSSIRCPGRSTSLRNRVYSHCAAEPGDAHLAGAAHHHAARPVHRQLPERLRVSAAPRRIGRASAVALHVVRPHADLV